MHPGLLAVFALLLAGAWFGKAAGPVTASQPVLSPAASAAASTAGTMDSQILTSINAARATRKLVSLRVDSRLAAWAGDRAAWMASRADLTHTSYGGSPCNLYVIERITWYQCGEAIADTTSAFGTKAASALYSLWRSSPEHFALITSTTFNYVGVGLAYRAANYTTYSSILFLQGPEHNNPIPSWTAASVSGQAVHWAWTAYEPKLQTHTAAVKNYYLELRRDDGAWILLRTNNTDTSATYPNLPLGTTLEIRIRARDTVGNVSAWLPSTTFTVH